MLLSVILLLHTWGGRFLSLWENVELCDSLEIKINKIKKFRKCNFEIRNWESSPPLLRTRRKKVLVMWAGTENGPFIRVHHDGGLLSKIGLFCPCT